MAGLATVTAAGLRGRRRWGTLALILVVALSALGIVTGLTVRDQGARLVDRVAARAEVAHLVLYGDPATLSRIAADDPAVRTAAGPFPVLSAELLQADGDIDTRLTAMPTPDVEVGRPALLHGRWMRPGTDEIVLDRSLARVTGLGVGDTVRLRRGATTTDARVVGTAIDLTDCSYSSCSARAYTSPALVEELRGDESTNQLLVGLDRADDADAVLTRLLTAYPGINGSDAWLDTRTDLLTSDRVFGAFLTGFGLFLLVAACVVLAGSMAARLAARRREVGLMKAVGVSPRQVAGSLLAEHLLLGLVGILIGWVVGSLLAGALSVGVGPVFGGEGPRFSMSDLGITVAVVSIILTITTLVPALRAGRVPATDVLRDVPAGAGRGPTRFADRLGLGPSAGLGLKDAVARPGRSMLSALALVVAVVAAVVSVGFVGTIQSALDHPAKTGDPWDAELETVRGQADAPTPSAVEATLGGSPDVAKWWGMIERRSIIDGRAFRSRAMSGVIGDHGFELGGGRAPSRLGEAMVGFGFLKEYGVDVGDAIDFTAGSTPVRVTITGWYRETDDSGRILVFGIDTLRNAEPGATPDSWQVVARRGIKGDVLAATLGERLGTGVRVMPHSVGDVGLGTFNAAMEIVALLVALVAGAQLLATTVASARERARDVGVLRAVGATTKGLLGQHALTAAFLGVVAVVIGLPLGLALYRVLSDAVSEGIGVGPAFGSSLSASAAGIIAVVTVVIAAAIGALAVSGLVRRPASELVRWE